MHLNVIPLSLSNNGMVQSTQFLTSELNGTVHLLTTLYRTISKLLYDVCYVCWLFRAYTVQIVYYLLVLFLIVYV